MSRFASALLLLVGPGVLAAQQPVTWQRRFVITGEAANGPARLDALLTGCNEQGAVSALLAREPVGPPLPIVLHTSVVWVLFGTPTPRLSDRPELQLDLADFDRLPTAAQVRTWPAESSWALTRCEALIHELAEGLEYQRRWPAAGAASNDTTPAAWRVHLVLHRAAHAFGIEQEHRVALAQATRVDSAGTPYMRVGSCSEPEARQLHLVLGPHTETLIFRADDALAIAYHPHENRCTLAGLPVRPNVPVETQ